MGSVVLYWFNFDHTARRRTLKIEIELWQAKCSLIPELDLRSEIKENVVTEFELTRQKEWTQVDFNKFKKGEQTCPIAHREKQSYA